MLTMISKCLKIIPLILLTAYLAACSSSRTLEPVELESFDEEGDLAVIWSDSISGEQGEYYHQFRLAQDEDHIYAASQNGFITKYTKEDGDDVWDIELDVRLTTGVAIDSKFVYVGSRDGAVIALDKNTGEQRWVSDIRSELVSVPVSDESGLYAHASNGDVYKFDVNTGEELWRVDTNIPALSLRGTSKPLLIPQLVVVGTANGKVALINRDSGQLIAEPKIANPEGDTEVERMVDVDGRPYFHEGILYAASFQGQLVALDMQKGQTIWDSEASSFQDVAYDFESVYLSTANSLVTAYNAKNGELKWVQEGLLRRRITAPVAYSSYLLVSDLDGYIHLLSQIDGRFIARRQIDGSGVKSPAMIDSADNSIFYIIANDGCIKAYRYEAD